MSAELLNDLGVLLIGCAILFPMIRSLRDESWKADTTRLDQERLRARIYYWPSVVFAGAMTGLIALFVIYQAALVLIDLWQMF